MKVFLSASFPKGERGAAVSPFSTRDISSAATAVVEATLREGGQLVFGGHPTITPIVHQIAEILGAGNLVHLYQSELFEPDFPDEVRLLESELGARLTLVPKVPGDQAASLSAMRQLMLDQNLTHAFFVGGMSGILEEYQAVLARTAAVCNIMEYPGGMAARLVQAEREQAAAHDVEVVEYESGRVRLLRGRAYPYLVARGLEPPPGGTTDTERLS